MQVYLRCREEQSVESYVADLMEFQGKFPSYEPDIAPKIEHLGEAKGEVHTCYIGQTIRTIPRGRLEEDEASRTRSGTTSLFGHWQNHSPGRYKTFEIRAWREDSEWPRLAWNFCQPLTI